MTRAEFSTTVLDNDNKLKEANAFKMGMKNSVEWRLIFQVYSSKNNAKSAVRILEVLLFLMESNNVVNTLETIERKIKEFEKAREET